MTEPDSPSSDRAAALAFCEAGGGSAEDFAAMGAFYSWGLDAPAEALDFAARASQLGALTETESIAIGLAHLGALGGLGQPMPFDVAVTQEYESDDEGGRVPVLDPHPEFRLDEGRLGQDIPGFGAMPGGFAAAALPFLHLLHDYWLDIDVDGLDESEFDDADAFADMAALGMDRLHRHYDMMTPPGCLARMAEAMRAAALKGELLASLPEAPPAARPPSI